MKADAASGYQTKISPDIDSQSQSSRELKMSGFSCNPGMQKNELFVLLLLISTLGKRDVSDSRKLKKKT